MAKSAKGKSRKKRKRTAAAIIAAGVALCIGILFAYMYIGARTVHVRAVTVMLEDLPPEFDGKKILFVTDVDLLGTNTKGSALNLMRRLERLEPDILLLGGDYASESMFERLNSSEQASLAHMERVVNARSRFLAGLSDFDAPLGKFAVSGEADQLPESLKISMEAAGIKLLSDETAIVSSGEGKISIVGLDGSADVSRGLTEMGSKISSAECVVVLAHNPGAYVSVQTSEASDGGAWADLMLSGHTHGGQILIGGFSALSMSEHEQRYIAGWRKEGDIVQLTSCGIGCAGANLRLGTEAEVHLITLRRGSLPEDVN